MRIPNNTVGRTSVPGLLVIVTASFPRWRTRRTVIEDPSLTCELPTAGKAPRSRRTGVPMVILDELKPFGILEPMMDAAIREDRNYQGSVELNNV
jgi:hypothetical protein